MTGYGKALCELPNKKVVVEIKTLNSKQLDVSVRVNAMYREKELEIRNLISTTLGRGKVDFSLYLDATEYGRGVGINTSVINQYHKQLMKLSEETSIPLPDDKMTLLMKMPDVFLQDIEKLDDNEWFDLKKVIAQCMEQVIAFRTQEGETLQHVFTQRIVHISHLLNEIENYENERIEKLRERLEKNLEKIADKVAFDSNRLEQELIYYIEKLDVSEEKVRLKNHLDYFLETMKTEDAPGKKLGFIAQEIGREINTLGSKSNHSEMQKIVVMMKDDLEQIKEQVLNTL